MQLLRDALTAVLHDDSKVRVALLGGDDDRGASVAHSVHQQIRDHPLQHEWISLDGEIRRDLEVQRDAFRDERGSEVGQQPMQRHRTGGDGDCLCVQAREVEQLLQEPCEPPGLLVPDAKQLLGRLRLKRVAPFHERRQDAEDGCRRRPKLV